MEIYLQPRVDFARLYAFEHRLGNYLCTDPVPYEEISKGVGIRLLRNGATNSESWDADASVYDLDGVRITRLAYIVPDNNQLFVVYAAKGAGSVVIDDSIPKSIAETHSSIRGAVSFLDLDPVLRIYLRAGAGQIDVRHYSIGSVAEIPKANVQLDFAPCSLSVVGFSVVNTSLNGKDHILCRFRVLDGDGRPVYIPGLAVRLGNDIINPQYSSDHKYYGFFAPADAEKVTIFADLSGCPRFEHEEVVSTSESGNLPPFLIATAVIAIILIFLRLRGG